MEINSINVSDDGTEVVINGDRVYKYKENRLEQMCGRREIAEYLDYHCNGKINVTNLYRNNKNAVLQFPNFEIEKAEGGEKPWTRREMEAWLSIPLNKRRQMYKEAQNAYDNNQ